MNSFNGVARGGALGSFSFLAGGGGGGSGGRSAARGGGSGSGSAAPPPSSGSLAAPRSQSGLLLLLDSRANDLHAQLPPPLWDDETTMLVLKVSLPA